LEQLYIGCKWTSLNLTLSVVVSMTAILYGNFICTVIGRSADRQTLIDSDMLTNFSRYASKIIGDSENRVDGRFSYRTKWGRQHVTSK